MSEENQVNEEIQVKDEKKSKCAIVTAMIAVTMLFSIATFVLLLINTLGNGSMHLPQREERPAQADNGPEVVISKQYDKGQSLAKARATKKPIVVFFYTDWCGFCQRFAPTFAKITKDKAIKNNFAVAYVNCEKEENQKDVQAFGIQGFPTVYVIKKDGSKTQLENGTFFNDDSVEVVKGKMLEIIGK